MQQVFSAAPRGHPRCGALGMPGAPSTGARGSPSSCAWWQGGRPPDSCSRVIVRIDAQAAVGAGAQHSHEAAGHRSARIVVHRLARCAILPRHRFAPRRICQAPGLAHLVYVCAIRAVAYTALEKSRTQNHPAKRWIAVASASRTVWAAGPGPQRPRTCARTRPRPFGGAGNSRSRPLVPTLANVERNGADPRTNLVMHRTKSRTNSAPSSCLRRRRTDRWKSSRAVT